MGGHDEAGAGAGIQLNDRFFAPEASRRGDKVVAWYDNEWGSGGAARCVDVLRYFAEREK